MTPRPNLEQSDRPAGIVAEEVRPHDVDLLRLVCDQAAKIIGGAVEPATNFFAAGGDSLDALELAAVLEDELGRPVSPAAVFETESLGDLVALVSRADESL